MTSTLFNKLLSLVVSLLLTSVAGAQPARIILLRHAEKPENDAEIHLSERGQQRARALAGWATNSPAWDANSKPTAVFACKPTAKAPSERSVETITPLAKQLQLTVQLPFSAKNFTAMAQQILKDPQLKGKTVIVCWAHDELPDLARALGVKEGVDKWRKNVFDRVWMITYPASGVEFTSLPQRLLPEDSKK